MLKNSIKIIPKNEEEKLTPKKSAKSGEKRITVSEDTFKSEHDNISGRLSEESEIIWTGSDKYTSKLVKPYIKSMF